MEFSLENPGFVTPSDSNPVSSPGSGPPLPPSGSSASSALLSSADEASSLMPQMPQEDNKLVYDRHNFCTKCRGFDCSFASRCEECANWSREEMEAYVKHRGSLKAKDIKVKDPLPRPPSPSDASVPSAQSVVASGDDVDRHIARLGQELSTLFARQFEDLVLFYVILLNNLVRMLLPKLSLIMLLLQLLRRFPLLTGHSVSNCQPPPRVSGSGWG